MDHKLNSILALAPPTTEGGLILREALFFQHTLRMRLFVLNVIKSPSVFSPKTKAQKTNELNEARQELCDFMKNILQKELPNHIIPRVKMGDTVSTLIKESKVGGYEFIVVEKSESSGEGDLTKSDIDKIVSKSQCPVLTINKNFPTKQIKNIVKNQK